MENRKFCPKCGTPNKLNDAYCIKCGYSFNPTVRKKKSFNKIILLIVLIIAGWVIYRVVSKQPIIPEGITNIFQNTTINSSE